MHILGQDIHGAYRGRDINFRNTDTITYFDLNQLRSHELFDKMSNDDYSLFRCFNKFSYLAIGSKKR